jgi:hypothetical protein
MAAAYVFQFSIPNLLSSPKLCDDSGDSCPLTALMFTERGSRRLTSQPAPMAATLSPQHVEDAANSSEPIIEDITELCKFCVELTRVIVQAVSCESVSGFRIPNTTPESRLESCRFCEMMSIKSCVTPAELKLRLISAPSIRQRFVEGGYFQHRRICGANIGDSTFSIWAEPGKKPKTCSFGSP